MAIPFRRSIDMTLKFINNVRLQHVAGDHSSTESGTYYYDSTANRPAVRTNSAYKRLAFTDDVPGAGELDAADINYDNGANSDLDATDVQAAIEELEDEKATPTQITSAINTHAGASDPHAEYQKESEKGANNGYASLDSSGDVPDAQIPDSIARDSEVTSAISSAITTHSGASDPHSEYQKESEKGQNNGYASLDSGGKVPVGQLPDTVVGALEYKGTWNANTNSPSLTSSGGGGTKGDYYKVATAGTTSVDGEASWAVGDWIVHNGTIWEKVDQTENVASVEGRTGAVTLGDLYPKKFSGNVGDGTAAHTVTHNLNTRDLMVTLRLAGTPWTVVTHGFEIDFPSTNTVRVQSDDNIATDELRITLAG